MKAKLHLPLKSTAFLLLIGTIFFSSRVLAQEGVGSWTDYFPYHQGNQIAVGKSVTYAATPYALIEFNRTDNSVSKFSKINGLTDVNPTTIAFNEVSESFVLGYANGKIDIITNDAIINLNDIFRSNITGNKSINNVYIQDEFAYLACGFGIVLLNMERMEIKETYLIGDNGDFLNVRDIVIHGDSIYAATAKGVRKAWLDDPELTFYPSWKKDLTMPDPNAQYESIEFFNNDLYVNYVVPDTNLDIMYVRHNNQWGTVPEFDSMENRSIRAFGDTLVLAHSGFTGVYDTQLNLIDKIFSYGNNTPADPNDAIIGKNGAVWIADRQLGMVYVPRPWSYEIASIAGPGSNRIEDLATNANRLWVAAGGRHNNYTNLFSNEGFFKKYSDDSWANVNKYNTPILQDVYDLITVAIDPFNSQHAFFGSLGGGLVEVTGETVENVFNFENSPLNAALDQPDWTGITGLDFDSRGNIWMANSRNPKAIASYTYDNQWYSMNLAGLVSGDKTGKLLVASDQTKWMILPGGGGILVYNENGTLDDQTDDLKKILNSGAGSGGLHTADIYSFAEDLDGEIWVGTAEGVAVFYSPQSVFTEGANFDAQRVILEVNGIFKYLLETQRVTAVAIDGANRKWFGTNGSGVFLMSSDGTKELHHFYKANSPLISDFVTSIKVNDVTGEVYIGTDQGIVGYKGTATGAEALEFETYAYPNPVRSDYFGPIAIKGLPANSQIRITDVAGNLVFNTIAEGTQAIWNGNNMNGERAATGVYIVVAIDTEGKSSQVAKILFIN